MGVENLDPIRVLLVIVPVFILADSDVVKGGSHLHWSLADIIRNADKSLSRNRSQRHFLLFIFRLNSHLGQAALTDLLVNATLALLAHGEVVIEGLADLRDLLVSDFELVRLLYNLLVIRQQLVLRVRRIERFEVLIHGAEIEQDELVLDQFEDC